MEFRPLAIEGVWLATSQFHTDQRGSFQEWFRADDLKEKTGMVFSPVQANLSVSSKGTMRGIHYSLTPQGQSKWISCVHGSIMDVVVDLRPASPTFKQFLMVELSQNRSEGVVISPGLGHGFLALEDNSAVSYLVTTAYAPEYEHSIHPLDSDLGITWPKDTYTLSTQDSAAPTLLDQLTNGKLP